jgi:hypothetical protein
MSGIESMTHLLNSTHHLHSSGSRRPGIVHDCAHGALILALEPIFMELRGHEQRVSSLQISCPDCWLDFTARFWQSTPGDWYLKVQEHLAAGRAWIYHYEHQVWHPAG